MSTRVVHHPPGGGSSFSFGERQPLRDTNYVTRLQVDQLKHAGVGTLSMANRGPHTNGSQFFLCTARTPHLDGKHVVFGSVTKGMHTLERIEQVGSKSGKTSQAVTIADCGQLLDGGAEEEAAEGSPAKRAKVVADEEGGGPAAKKVEGDIGIYDDE